MVTIGTPMSDPPKRKAHDRAKYREIWDALTETPRDEWLPVKFENFSDAAKFALTCKTRRHQNKAYGDLDYYQRDDTVYVRGRAEAGA